MSTLRYHGFVRNGEEQRSAFVKVFGRPSRKVGVRARALGASENHQGTKPRAGWVWVLAQCAYGDLRAVRSGVSRARHDKQAGWASG